MKTFAYLSLTILSTGCDTDNSLISGSKQDLVISDVKWSRTKPDKIYGDYQANLVSFTIKNTSSTTTYYKFSADFVGSDPAGQPISTEQDDMATTIKPGALVSITKRLEDTNPTMSSVDVTVRSVDELAVN